MAISRTCLLIFSATTSAATGGLLQLQRPAPVVKDDSYPLALATLRLRGGESSPAFCSLGQGVLAASGGAALFSGITTMLRPEVAVAQYVVTRAMSSRSGKSRAASRREQKPHKPQDQSLVRLLGMTLLGWGFGKLSVKRGDERRFCQLNFLPMAGALALAVSRGARGVPVVAHACLSGLYMYVGFKPSDQIIPRRFLEYLPDKRYYMA